jgi:hypothetical protein
MNKITFLLIAGLIFNFSALSQKKLSVSAFIGLGTSSFRGPGAVNSSIYYRSDIVPSNPPNWDPGIMTNPYGKKPFANFVAGLHADVQFSSKWILQLNSQYEYTGARLTIDSVITPTTSINTNGVYTRYYDLVSINPGLGSVLFQNSSSKLILHGGLDYVFNISMGFRNEYQNERNGKNYSIGGSGDNPEINDFRLTGGATFMFKKVGIDLTYKHGLANFNKNGTAEVYSRLFHVRFLYSLIRRSL